MEGEAKLWDKKYLNSREYENVEDIFKFCESNPSLKEVVPLIKNEENFRVLEIGSGTGELILYIKNKNPKVSAFGLDFSEESIKRSKLVSDRFDLGVEFKRGDIATVPYPDEYFDIVYGDQVIGHVEDKDKALAEIYRVMKKGGILALTIGNALRLDGWYLNTLLSKSHQGYRQENMLPWMLSSTVRKSWFKPVKFYGDMMFLFRNISLIKFYFKKNKITPPHNISSASYIKMGQDKKLEKREDNKSLLKKIYHGLDGVFPPWAKVTVGILARK